jgi:peptidoglycan hydrolase-like protein with peptidoglycan-binding domain
MFVNEVSAEIAVDLSLFLLPRHEFRWSPKEVRVSNFEGVVSKLIKFASSAVVLVTLILSTLTTSAASTNPKKRKDRQLTRSELKGAEQRLSEMGYQTGPIDGVIDGATRSGIIIFQKWEGRKVTGRLNRAEFDAILNAEAPRPRDEGYRHVEVDLDRQLLILTDDEGAITRILPVSTGSNRRYRAKGMRGLAYTPRGRFRIYAKLFGWRKSPLGLLYYPNYFSDGLAIHGNPSVPSTPQSHGCIRIPMSAAAQISKALPVGTIVLIYDSESFVSAKDWAAADRQKQETSQ